MKLIHIIILLKINKYLFYNFIKLKKFFTEILVHRSYKAIQDIMATEVIINEVLSTCKNLYECESMFSQDFYKNSKASFKDIMDVIIEFCKADKDSGLEALTDLYYRGEIHMIPFEYRYQLAELYSDHKTLVKFLLMDTYLYYTKFDKNGFPVPELKPNNPITYLKICMIPKLKEKYNSVNYNEVILYTFTENIKQYLYNMEAEEEIMTELDKTVRTYIKKPNYSRLVSAFALILSNANYKGYEKPLNKSLKKIMTGK